MTRILVDTNIILDIALKREPFFNNSAEVIRKIDNKNIIAFITATTISDIYYIAKKEKGHKKALGFIRELIEIINVAGVDHDVILNALESELLDFEDSIQESAAISEQIDIIITRNISDFKNSNLKIFNPEDFIKYIKNK